MSKENLNVANLFFEKAEQYPQLTAIIDKTGQRYSYGELRKDVLQTAAYLYAEGIRKGDRVQMLVPLSAELYRNFLALIYLGATVVFIDQWAGAARMRACRKVAECRAFIAPFKLRFLAPFLGIAKGRGLDPSGKTLSKKALPPMASCAADEAAMITFTTGTSGEPKGAVRTHAILQAQFEALSEFLAADVTEKDSGNLPIVFLLNLAAGKTSIIPPELRDPGIKTVQHLVKETADTLSCSPAFAASLSEHQELAIKKLFIGGACVFKEDVQKLSNAWPGAEVLILYGSSEAEPIASVSGEELVKAPKERGLLLGKAHPAAQVIIVPSNYDMHVEESVEKLALPPNATGEICVAGPHVVKEYFNNREATLRNKIRTGVRLWHRTGDLGYLDTKGNLYLLGRKQYCRVINGINYYPVAIEKLARTFPGVEFSAFVVKKERPLLVIEQKEIDRGALWALLEDAGYELEVVYMKHIPRDKRHNSRPDYERLMNVL